MIDYLKNIPYDKKLHLVAGALIGIITMFFLTPIVGEGVAAFLGVLVAAVIGQAKEVYDGKHPDKHTRDEKDLIATVIGGILGVFIFSVIKYVIL